MAKRLLNVTDKVKQYFEPSSKGLRLRDIVREIPGQALNTGAQIGRSLASTPIRTGASIAEIPRTLSGGKPFQPFNVPVLGQQKTYARDAVDTVNRRLDGGTSAPMAIAEAVTGAGGRAVGDIALLGGVAQKLAGETPTKFFQPKEEPLFVSKGRTEGIENPQLKAMDQADDAFASAEADLKTNNYTKMYDNYIKSGELSKWKIYKDPDARILEQDAAKQLVSNTQAVLDKAQKGLGEQFAKSIDLTKSTPEMIQKKALETLYNSKLPVSGGTEMVKILGRTVKKGSKEYEKLLQIKNQATDLQSAETSFGMEPGQYRYQAAEMPPIGFEPKSWYAENTGSYVKNVLGKDGKYINSLGSTMKKVGNAWEVFNSAGQSQGKFPSVKEAQSVLDLLETL